MTPDAPRKNSDDSAKPKNSDDTSAITKIATEVANAFNMLSAYLITAAINRPPAAWMTT